MKHVCLNWTPGAESPSCRSELTEDGKDSSVSGGTRVLTTDPRLIVRLAVAGVGLAIIYRGLVRHHIDAGELVPVLEAYCPPFPGLYRYCPRRRYRSAALRAFIDFVCREVRR